MFQLRWSELLLHEPLGQVEELVSATARRVRLAVGELRAVVAAGGRAGRGRGRSVSFLADVTDEVLSFAQERLKDVGCEVLGCRQRVSGSDQQRTGAEEERGSGEGQGAEERQWAEKGQGAEEEQGAAGAGEHPRPIGAGGMQQAAQKAVRYSYAAVELLPQVSAGVQLFAEVEQWDRVGGVRGQRAVKDAALEASAYLMGVSPSVIPTALECVNLILAKHIRAAAERQGVSAAGGGGAGSSGGGGRSALPGRGVDTPWRQLLLQELRLMGLLGAAAQLWNGVEAEYSWVKHFAQEARKYDLSRKQLSAAMDMSAVAFSVEFRTAAGGKRAAGCSAVPGAAAAAGKRATGGGGRRGRCAVHQPGRCTCGDGRCGLYGRGGCADACAGGLAAHCRGGVGAGRQLPLPVQGRGGRAAGRYGGAGAACGGTCSGGGGSGRVRMSASVQVGVVGGCGSRQDGATGQRLLHGTGV